MVQAESGNGATSAHRLDSIAGVAVTVVNALKQQWVETAEEALAVLATPEGPSGVKRLLDLDDATLTALEHTLRQAVGTSSPGSETVESSPPALGVVLTADQKRRFGIE